MIAKDTVVAKLLCHDLDEPPDVIHYASSLAAIGSGQLFEQVLTAGNFIPVSTRWCISSEFFSPRRWSHFMATVYLVLVDSAKGAGTQQRGIWPSLLSCWKAFGQVLHYLLPAIIFSFLS